MKPLQRGQRIKVADLTPKKDVVISLNLVAPRLTLDYSCFGLDAQGKLSDDRYLVFYNQKLAPNNVVQMLGGRGGDSETFAIDLNRLPSQIQRLVFVASIDGPGAMSDLQASYLRVLVPTSGTKWDEAARFSFTGSDFADERALMIGEVYLKDEWRILACGQGFAGGLDAVVKHFGGEVTDSPTPAVPPPLRPQKPPAPSIAAPLVPRPTPPTPRVPDGKHCTKCGAVISFWEKTTGKYNAQTGRCHSCEQAAIQRERAAIQEIQNTFRAVTMSGALTQEGWKRVEDLARARELSQLQVQQAIHDDALRFLDYIVQASAADGIITPEEDANWNQTLRLIALPESWVTSFRGRWAREKQLSDIRRGKLPSVTSPFHLDSGEICHLCVAANYLKATKTTTAYVPVTLTATSKKIYISEGATGGREVQYSKFLRILPDDKSVTLELSVRAGSGTYFVPDPPYVDAVLSTLVRMSKRQLVGAASEGRHIPQDVKRAVWQRDGGKCVECGASGTGAHLEYDHDIPFSKGGANTINNLRLLCRRCNLAKGDRI